MNPVFPARRRAEAFSSMVEAASTTRLHDTDEATSRYAADLGPLVGLVTTLRSTPTPEARPEFVADLRGRLLLAAETALAPDTEQQLDARRTTAPRRTGRERRLAVAVGGFALVSASASMSVAAQTALPGDTLYPLKRALESIHETVVRDADDRGTTMLDNASGRLDEVDQLSRAGEQDADVIAQTLQDFTDQAVEASDVLLGDFAETGRLSSIEELQSFTASSLDVLRRLEGLVPVEARGSLIEAARVLDRIYEQAVAVCPACGDALPALEDALSAAELGPLYEKLLADVPKAPVRHDDGARAPAKPSSKPTKGADPAPVEQPAEEAESEESTPPGLPQGPSTHGGDGSSGSDTVNAVVKGLNDPLGDLLTGITEVAEDLLSGGKDKPKK